MCAALVTTIAALDHRIHDHLPHIRPLYTQGLKTAGKSARSPWQGHHKGLSLAKSPPHPFTPPSKAIVRHS